MPQLLESPPVTGEFVTGEFIDRRSYDPTVGLPGRERRQFTNSYEELSGDAQELAQAIDRYKLTHRRRFITYEEILHVVQSLGYHR